MRLVEVLIPAGKREAIVDVLDDEGIDYAITEETSGREYTAIVTFPLPTDAVEPVLDRLRDAGIENDAYTVVLDAETVVSRRFERLRERYEGKVDEEGGRIAREEIHARAQELAPNFLPFAIMTVVSAVVATAGVLIDSPAVVVGSMVIAPLVGPAMSTSVGTVVDDDAMFRRGVRLQAIGVVLAMVASAIFAGIVRGIGLVPPAIDLLAIGQYAGRLTPDFLSLAVALGAGIAGAISIASGASIALVGVMIAAALVPPIAVAGIGVAYAKPMTVLSAGVLVLVNVLSINLAALAVHWQMGYRPDSWFKASAARSATVKRILALVVAIAVLSTFLGGVTYFSFANAQFENDVREQIDATLGPDPTAAAGYERFSVIDTEVRYGEELPFRRPQEVIVTVGRPATIERSGLADVLERRINSRTAPPLGILGDQRVDVEVRYVTVECGNETDCTESEGTTALGPPGRVGRGGSGSVPA